MVSEWSLSCRTCWLAYGPRPTTEGTTNMRKLSWLLLTLFAIAFAGGIANTALAGQGNQGNQAPGAQGNQGNQAQGAQRNQGNEDQQ